MPKLRALSGRELVSIFQKLGFVVASQRGSHIKLRRMLKEEKQTFTIPNHHELDRGTLKAIYKQALRFVSEPELRPYFYAE